jgi:chromosome segregation ATPase
MGYVVMTTSPWSRGWHEIKWDFEYTGESMGEVGKLASELYGKVSRLEERADSLVRQANDLGADRALLARELKASREQVERQVKTILDQNDALEKRERTIARLKEELEGQRDHASRRAKTQDAIIAAQKKVLSTFSTEVANGERHIDALVDDLERVKESHAKLTAGVAKVIERVSKCLGSAQRARSYPISVEGIDATARRYAYGQVHRWLSALLENEPPDGEPQDEALTCVNCEAAEPAHAS